MKKWLIFLPALILLAACAAVDLSSPDVEPALTAVIQPQATDTAESTAEPTEEAVPEATETAVPVPQAQANAAVEAEEAAAPARSETAAAGTVLIFHRSGGFAGLDQQWTIYGDGRIELPDGSQKQADTAQIQTLLDTIQSANFFDLNESYVPKDACCDRFNYSITVQLGGQSKTVNTIDDAPKQPEQLTAVLDSINKLLSTLP